MLRLPSEESVGSTPIFARRSTIQAVESFQCHAKPVTKLGNLVISPLALVPPTRLPRDTSLACVNL